MSFASLRSASSERFRQVRSLLTLIKEREGAEVRSHSDDTKLLRGLFFVNLYAAFEYSVNAVVQQALRSIASRQPKMMDLELRFNAVSLHALFQSFADAKAKSFRKRLNILDAQISSNPCTVNDAVFAPQLQNIWADTLVDVCDCLCVGVACLKDVPTQIYINEVVDRRNAVAHGRESPVDVGARMISSELEVRLQEISKVVDELTTALEVHVDQLGFLRSNVRAQYAST